jgi:sterol desaturase/sphingolipid hydroxylase (fatty acid hydroxylase superfamily)
MKTGASFTGLIVAFLLLGVLPFHRWHHTSEAEGLDKNFAGLFPFIDVAFGTFYLPSDRRAEKFGLAGESVPEGFVAQLLYPFRRASG